MRLVFNFRRMEGRLHPQHLHKAATLKNKTKPLNKAIIIWQIVKIFIFGSRKFG